MKIGKTEFNADETLTILEVAKLALDCGYLNEVQFSTDIEGEFAQVLIAKITKAMSEDPT